jgi:hypothetical protein
MEALFTLLTDLVMNPVTTALDLFWRGEHSLLLAAVLSGGLALAGVLSRWSTIGMSRAFTRFWFTHQQKLREALKKARVQSAGEQPLSSTVVIRDQKQHAHDQEDRSGNPMDQLHGQLLRSDLT